MNAKSLRYRVALLALCVLLTACASAMPCPRPAADDTSGSIYVIRHRWHTGIILSADRIPATLDFLHQQLSPADYYEFGWGDAGFYPAPEERFDLAARALFLPTDSVMHVVAITGDPARLPHRALQKITVSNEGLKRLGESLANSFHRSGAGSPAPLGPSLYGRGFFYPGSGRFWFGRNCNTWTAAMLAEAGLNTGVLPKLTAGSIMRLSRRISKECE